MSRPRRRARPTASVKVRSMPETKTAAARVRRPISSIRPAASSSQGSTIAVRFTLSRGRIW